MSFSTRLLPRLGRTTLLHRPSSVSFSTTRLIRYADPYPLPLSNPDLASLASRSTSSHPDSIDEYPLPQPLDRTGEDEKTLRARLVYQTRKRGTLETDLLLATFGRDFLGEMTVDEMRLFDKLLDEPDWDIYYWSIGKKEAPSKWKDTELLKKLQRHAKNEGKVVRMMPALMQGDPETL
ncbi:mitochondrion protein [Naematelia encephala]|uniref:Succinate dehydrogenase assembly factor 2, mitochondrial n=1 Tax=Naematelia encephala TaxID=71784 RepID=A0A1Y2AVK2_9TREE|nr:mitochondrion protein [Naematelia encephala]